MALARKCDICGRYYEPYNMFFASGSNDVNTVHLGITDEYNEFHSIVELDCCQDCMKIIKNTIDSIKPVKEIANE